MQTNIVFLHGFLGSPMDWAPVTSFMNNWNCIPLSYPKLEKYSIDALGDAIRLYCEPIGKAHFVGYSMGGRILLDIFDKNPDLFLSLTLESVNPGLATAEEKKLRSESDHVWAQLLESDPDRFYVEWYQQEIFGFNKDNRAHYRALVQDKMKTHLSLYSQILVESSVAQNPSQWSILESAKIPILYIAGERDAKYLNIAERISKTNHQIKVQKISKAGHNTHFENPSHFADILKMFIREISLI